ncbi:glycosyltransferase [Azospirillum brasilense]|uniref:glycosyltransferase n=1 Tax=Azospirillum brasilense TaxID=192 RepID=UPI0031F2D77F
MNAACRANAEAVTVAEPSIQDVLERLFASVRYRDALTVLDGASGAIAPGMVAGWRRRLLANLGDFEAALCAAREAVACNPEFADEHFRLAEILARCGRYADAFVAARNVYEMDSTDIRPLAVCVEAALADPSLRPAFLSWSNRSGHSGTALAAAPLGGPSSGILLPVGRAAFSSLDGNHPDALSTIHSAQELPFCLASSAPGGALAALSSGFAHCVRVCDALTAIHPLVDHATAARYVGQRALSLLDDGQGAAVDLLPTLPMTVGQRPYVLLFDLIPALFQPFEPYVRHGISASRSPLYWIVRAFLESSHCVSIYSPYQKAQSLLGRFFKSPVIERKTTLVDHVRPTAARSATTSLACGDGLRRPDQPTLLFTASAINPQTKFYLRGGAYVLKLFEALSNRFPNLRLILRTPLPDTLAPALRDVALNHPNVHHIDRELSYEEYLAMFQKSHIFLSPSAALYMNSALNAMRHGAVPVITDAFGSPDLIRHDRNGVLVPMPPEAVAMDAENGEFSQDLRVFMDAEALGSRSFLDRLSDAVAGLLENPERLQRLSRQAMDDVAQGFPGCPTGTPMSEILERALSDGKNVILRGEGIDFLKAPL